jgi:hypothetical protein
MVCNWRFHGPFLLNQNSCDVYYNYYNTGRDGFEWDLIQLIYLAASWQMCHIQHESPIFHAVINGLNFSLDDICRSYLAMMINWFQAPNTLWNLTDAAAASAKVLESVRFVFFDKSPIVR